MLDLQAVEFQAWRHHPVSKVVLQYIEDYNDAVYRTAFDAFVGGSLTGLMESEMRGRFLAWRDVSELRFESLLEFYGVSVEAPKEQS